MPARHRRPSLADRIAGALERFLAPLFPAKPQPARVPVRARTPQHPRQVGRR